MNVMPDAQTTAILLALLSTLNGYFAWRGARNHRRPLSSILLPTTLFALAAFFLWRALFPPTPEPSAAVLHVHGIGSPQAEASADQLVLPEAGTRGGERVPDLASALRTHPGIRRIVLHGYALPQRDLDALGARHLELTPQSLPAGLHRLRVPRWLGIGEALSVSGQVDGINDARLELRGPDDAVLAQTRINTDGTFELATPLHNPGRVVLSLRLYSGEQPIESTPIAVATHPSPPLRLGLLAAPDPELKYLRRWATDAGVEVHTSMQLSPTVRIGERLALDPQSLARLDLLIVDDQRWQRLGRDARADVLAAARAGLGVLVRLREPPNDATRRSLAELGLHLVESDVDSTVSLAPDHAESDDSPDLNRFPIRLTGDAWQGLGPGTATASGAWQPLGRGRVGVWLLSDSYRLILAGQPGRHGRLWQAALDRLARARRETPPEITPDDARVGERVSLCATPGATLRDPLDAEIALSWQPDPAHKQPCAAFWPTRSGWYQLTSTDSDWPIFIRAADDAPGLHRQRLLDATYLHAIGTAPPPDVAASSVPHPTRLMWLLGLFTSLTALWLLERRADGC